MDIENRIRSMHKRRVSRHMAANVLAVSPASFNAMVEALGLDWPNDHWVTKVTIDGIHATWTEHAKRLGMPDATLRRRYRFEGAAAVSRPYKEKISQEKVGRFVQLRKELSGVMAAKTVGHDYNTLHKLANEWFPAEYRQIRESAPRRRRSRKEIECQHPIAQRATP